MKRFHVLAVVGCALLLGSPVMAQKPQSTSGYPSKWEYRVVLMSDISGTNQPFGRPKTGPLQQGLAQYGADGWELVSVDSIQGNKVAIFKRPLRK